MDEWKAGGGGSGKTRWMGSVGIGRWGGFFWSDRMIRWMWGEKRREVK